MPPSVESVIRGAPLALLALAVPIVGLAAGSLFERPTEEERDESEQEAVRRSMLLRDMIDILRRNEDASKKAAGAVGEPLKPCLEREEGTNDSDNPEAESLPDDEEEEDDGQVTFEDLFNRCGELADIKPGAPELEEGIERCATLLIKETRSAIRKTKAQKDIKYADGSRLRGLLASTPEILDLFAKQAKFSVPESLRSQVRAAAREGWSVCRARRLQDAVKAIKMLALAKDSIPWEVASSVVSAVAVSIGTMSLHYRALALKALQGGTESAGFATATKAMVLVELLAATVRVLQAQLSSQSRARMARSIQVKLYEAMLSKDLSWWANQKRAGGLVRTVTGLPSQVRKALETPQRIVNRIMSICIQVALVRQHSSQMLYAMLALHWGQLGLGYVINWLQGRLDQWATAGLVLPSQDKYSWVHALNPEYIQMFQSFGRTKMEAKDLAKYLKTAGRSDTLQQAVTSITQPLRALTRQAGSLGEFACMGRLVAGGSLDISQAETISHYAMKVGEETEDAFADFNRTQSTLEPLAKAYDYIAIPAKIDITKGSDPGRRARGHFRFEDVRFSYPGRKTDILKGVTFEVLPGQCVGITGTTGCGKSTTIRLVERFYDVTDGRILLDGEDIRSYKAEWLRSQIMSVVQEPKLLPLSIRENLVFGCLQAPSREQIEQACRAANIWDVLRDPQKFPNGLETKMTAIQNVSGGEKQRICIARAILADRPILLLDEATSALDEVSQAQVQEALNKLMKDRTTLVIAHRLSTIKEASKIIVMEDGRVVDDGPHEELLKKNDGVWKRLWLRQSSESPAAAPAAAEEFSASSSEPAFLPDLPESLPSRPPLLRSRPSGHDESCLYEVMRRHIHRLAGGDKRLIEPALQTLVELQELQRRPSLPLPHVALKRAVSTPPIDLGPSFDCALRRTTTPKTEFLRRSGSLGALPDL